MPDDAVVGILGGKLGHLRSERAAHFHARENEVDAVWIAALHALEKGPGAILFAYALFRLHDPIGRLLRMLRPDTKIIRPGDRWNQPGLESA